MKNIINRSGASAAIGLFIGGLAHSSFAADSVLLAAGAGIESHSDAAHDGSDKSDLKQITNADIGYKKDDGALNIDLGYRAAYGNYLRNVLNDETSIDGKTALTWHAAPRLLDVVLYHQIAQHLIDRRGLDVPNNREERSVITGGFDFFQHLSAVDSLVLSPRFVDIRFQETGASDSQRKSMSARWDHKINKVSYLDLTAGYDDVTFDDSVNDYKSPKVFLSFHAALSRLSYQFGVGANQIKRDQGHNINGSMFQVVADYKGEENIDWGGSYIRQLTDSSIGLSNVELSLDKFQSNDSNFNQFGIIQVDKLDLYWHDKVGVSNLFSLAAGYLKQDYKDQPRDQNVASAFAGYQYIINPRWSVGADVRYENVRYLDEPKQKYDTTRAYLRASYKPLRALEINFSVGRDARTSDTLFRNYTDRVATIGFRYRIL